MQIFDKPDSLVPNRMRGVGLGFFDGVHRGHLELLRVLAARSKELSLLPAVFTFPSHPETVLNPEDLFDSYLGDLSARMNLIAGAGVNEVHLQAFDRDFADMEPEVFLDVILEHRLQARLIVVGPDYRFGRGGRGGIQLLRQWAGQRGIEVVVVPQVTLFGSRISSSRIRKLIEEGGLAEAASLLGRPYRLSGRVVTGRGLGHHLGFPTANIPVPSYLACPAYGVYATRTIYGGRAYDSVSNIGLRPTVEAGNVQPVIETYLLDLSMQLYGEDIDIDFLDRIRPEERFGSIEELARQVRADVESVRLWHKNHEQGYELASHGGISLYYLPTSRFSQGSLHVVFYTPLSARQSACQTLLMRVLTACCRRYPARTELAAALDTLYGSSIEANLEKQGDLQQIDLEAEGLISWTDGSSPFHETCRILFDMLFDPLVGPDGLFDEGIVEAERQNLLLEMASRENDRAKYAYDRCIAIFCGGQVQGLPPGGSIDDVRSVTRNDLSGTYRDLLNNSKVALFLGGPAGPAVVETCLAAIRRFPENERPAYLPAIFPSPFIPAEPADITDRKKVEQARINLMYTGMPPYFSHQTIHATLLNSMLGGDVHSLLFDVVREKLGLAYSVFSMNQRCLNALAVMAGVAPEHLEKAAGAIREQVEVLAGGKFEASLFDRSRMMIESALLSAGDELPAMMSRLISSRLFGRDLTLRESISLLSETTPEDITKLAGRMKLVTRYILAPEDLA